MLLINVFVKHYVNQNTFMVIEGRIEPQGESKRFWSQPCCVFTKDIEVLLAGLLFFFLISFDTK